MAFAHNSQSWVCWCISCARTGCRMQILCVHKWCARERFAPTANKKAAEYSLLNTTSKKSYLFVFTLVLRAGQTFWPKINIQVASYCYYHTLASAVYRHPLFSHSSSSVYIL
jgi:hypothetical protein